MANRLLQDKAAFYTMFSLMYNAGISVSEIFHMFSEQHSESEFGQNLRTITVEIEQGIPIYESMAGCRAFFSRFEVETIRAAYNAGGLHLALTRLGIVFSERHRLYSRLRSSLIYPLFLLTVCLGVVIFLPPYLFAGLFDLARSTGRPMPLISQLVAQLSDFARSPLCLVLVVGLALFASSLWRNEDYRQAALKEALEWGRMGRVVREFAVINFCYAWVLLMDAGVPIQTSLTAAGGASGIEEFARRIEDARVELETTGGELVDVLESTQLFSPFFLSGIAVGCETGSLPHILSVICSLQEELLEIAVDSLIALLEPLILVLLGLITGTVAVAALLPLANLLSDFA